MSINLEIVWDHPSAISNAVRYARIDNTISPVFTNAGNFAGSSGSAQVATNIADGQYQVEITPIYADGRTCNPTVIYTDPCAPLLAINAQLVSGNLVISYLAPSTAPKVRITVNYPNGGSSIANYVNTGTNIVVALPPGVTGTYTVSGQTVCDESSGFFSAPSSQVSVDVVAFNVSIANFVAGIILTNVTGIAGFALASNIPNGTTQTGTHTAFYGGIVFTFTGTETMNSSATVQINGTIIQCVNLPNTAGGTVTFTAASYAATDLITITFNNGVCP